MHTCSKIQHSTDIVNRIIIIATSFSVGLIAYTFWLRFLHLKVAKRGTTPQDVCLFIPK